MTVFGIRGDRVSPGGCPPQPYQIWEKYRFAQLEVDMTSAKSSSDGHGSKRGFASMDEAKQREIASKGGKAAHEKGTAHEFDSSEASKAGKKGGASQKGSGSSPRSPSSSSSGSSVRQAKAGSQSHKHT
jgi:uncharacterized protein